MGMSRTNRFLFDQVSHLFQVRPLREKAKAATGEWFERLMRKRLIIVELALLAACLPALFAQSQNAALAERSSIIIRGKVLRAGASEEPMLAASARTAVVAVQQMLAGSEIAGDQANRTITVILSRPDSVKPGEEAFFYGNPRFLGKSLTMVDEGEVPAQSGSAAESTAEARKNRPVRARLAAAALVFRGTVESVKPLEKTEAEGENRRASEATSEHDPEWNLAVVKVVTPLKGAATGEVSVIFAASRDITWFNSPKLKVGQDAVFLPHAPTKEEEVLYRSSGLLKRLESRAVYLVTEPFDVLQSADEDRVRSLLAAQKETNQ